MAYLGKGIAVFVLLTVSLTISCENQHGSDSFLDSGATKNIVVEYFANVSTPIQYKAKDYEGPYDPADPTGKSAAARRASKMKRQHAAQVIKSYIPPGFGDYAKTQFVGLAKSEGKRFVFAHPREAADILGVVRKSQRLAKNVSKKIKREEKKRKGRKHK